MKISILAFLILAIFGISCTEPPPPTLSYLDRKLVDSLFQLEVTQKRPHFDSLCTARFDSAVAYKADSMMKVRQAEIQKYLERIKMNDEL